MPEISLVHYHFIGIGGIGMSSLAAICKNLGFKVSGSDLCRSYLVDSLCKIGIEFTLGHSGLLLRPATTVVYSSDIKRDNVEFLQAEKLGCKLLHRSELLNQVLKSKISLSVAGTHGKTTTTAMLAAILTCAGLDPSLMLGGVQQANLQNWQIGQSDYFVFEADESDGSFLNYQPAGAIITNIDNDHLENYEGSFQLLTEAFKKFSQQVKNSNLLVWCADCHELCKLKLEGLSYGFSDAADWQIKNINLRPFATTFDLKSQNTLIKDIYLPSIGKHTVLNCAAACVLAHQLQVPSEVIKEGLQSFAGVKRRFEVKGSLGQVVFMDDYAHHPVAIDATLSAIKSQLQNQRLIAVFQPHRYSRTQRSFTEFTRAFKHADLLVITDVYAAGEKPIEGITGYALADQAALNHDQCQYIERKELAQKMLKWVLPEDTVVTLGAGDINQLFEEYKIVGKFIKDEG